MNAKNIRQGKNSRPGDSDLRGNNSKRGEFGKYKGWIITAFCFTLVSFVLTVMSRRATFGILRGFFAQLLRLSAPLSNASLAVPLLILLIMLLKEFAVKKTVLKLLFIAGGAEMLIALVTAVIPVFNYGTRALLWSPDTIVLVGLDFMAGGLLIQTGVFMDKAPGKITVTAIISGILALAGLVYGCWHILNGGYTVTDLFLMLAYYIRMIATPAGFALFCISITLLSRNAKAWDRFVRGTK